MAKTTFSVIEPLIESQKVLAGAVAVSFACHGSTRSVRAQAIIGKVSPARVSVWTKIHRSMMAALADTLQPGANGDPKLNFRREDVQAAIVAAFESIRTSFRWDEEERRWFESSTEASSFQARLRDMPVNDPYDQSVLVRTLIELSKSDGMVSTEELLFISDFIHPGIGSLEAMIQMDSLSPEELKRTSPRARPSIVMLAWACALSDEHLDAAETARIEELATAFGISATESDQLRIDAQQFLLRQALSCAYVDGERDEEAYAEVTFAAERMGVDAEAARELDELFRQEMGLDAPYPRRA
jgi:uncharacterized membrane protein YebE (DUF533 family)